MNQDEALLGLATTRRLLEELEARFRITTPNLSAQWVVEKLLGALTAEELEYRTVDS